VLDSFAGSGTTLEAAQAVGRHAIGIDIDSRNADLAQQRVGMFLEIDGEAWPTPSTSTSTNSPDRDTRPPPPTPATASCKHSRHRSSTPPAKPHKHGGRPDRTVSTAHHAPPAHCRAKRHTSDRSTGGRWCKDSPNATRPTGSHAYANANRRSHRYPKPTCTVYSSTHPTTCANRSRSPLWLASDPPRSLRSTGTTSTPATVCYGWGKAKALRAALCRCPPVC